MKKKNNIRKLIRTHKGVVITKTESSIELPILDIQQHDSKVIDVRSPENSRSWKEIPEDSEDKN